MPKEEFDEALSLSLFDREQISEADVRPPPVPLVEPEPEPAPVEQTDLNGVDLPQHKAPAEVAMHPTALVFLDDPLARRLAVAWQSCRGNEARWLEAAGIEETRGMFAEANRLTAALRINHICRDGGVTDSLALRYIASIVSKALTPPNRKEPK